MLRLRREGQITGKQVPEIILLNSHDGTSSYQMLPGLFRAVCQNGLGICFHCLSVVLITSFTALDLHLPVQKLVSWCATVTLRLMAAKNDSFHAG